MFYTDINSSKTLNPGITPRFAVLRGVRQGCPISPKLFILATHMLTLLVKNDQNLREINLFDKEYKISQFADDSAIFLHDKSMVESALNLRSPSHHK